MRLNNIPLICLYILIVYSCKQSPLFEKDSQAPVVTILTPHNNDVVSDIVTVFCIATDNEAIEKVELWLDGEHAGISDSTEPYNLEWNTIGYENKTYTMTARGYDINKNITVTSPINIKVDNYLGLTIPTTTTSTIFVKTEPDLRAAIKVENSYIIIENDITLTTSSSYQVGTGVIINGYGNNYGTGGKILYANGIMPSGAFFEMGKDSEIWGIRLIGNNSSGSMGIIIYNKNNVKIRNCEIVGFSNYAISFGGNTSSTYKKGYIISNYIHDNQQSPYGYGIVIDRNSEIYINNNKFKNNRHHVASRDLKRSNGIDYLGVRYEASYNTILANSDDEEAHFDVHGNDSFGACSSSGFLWDSGQAGSWIKIHHNQFLGNNDVHVLIRGVPVSTVSSGGGYRIYSNDFGPDKNQIMTCENISLLQTNVAIIFTDSNIVNGDNFNTYVTISENY